uniref:Uncharacterized protein n=1 Tax=Siphoviridae sp. ctLqe90 TaxID=2825456 RepID=A0A8S5Q343_9CAUD|nr:MAG TPA: hypothetical protein [Siphoviridae sp. ctLqe90]
MKQIRRNVFETNSSSSHSLVITTDNEHYTREEINKNFYMTDGIVRLWESSLEFYRSPFDMLATFKGKLRYAIASSNGNLVDQCRELCYKYVDGFVDFEFDTKDYVWDSEVNDYVEAEEPIPNYGGTDDYQIEGWLKKYNVSLEEFLTNKRYIVVVDGDEYAIYDHIKKSGLFDTSKIVHDSYAEEEEEWREQYLAQLEKEKEDADSKHED